METAELPLFYSPIKAGVFFGHPLEYPVLRLFKNLSNLTCTYCTTTFADCETKTFVKRYRIDKFNSDSHVVARHYHLYTLWKSNLSCNVKCTDEELRTIVIVEWSMTTTLVFLQYVNLSLEFLVRMNCTRFSKYLSSLDLFLVDTTEKKTYVVTSLSFVKDLTEHLDTSNDCLLRLFTETYDFNLITCVDNSCLDTSCRYCTTSCD